LPNKVDIVDIFQHLTVGNLEAGRMTRSTNKAFPETCLAYLAYEKIMGMLEKRCADLFQFVSAVGKVASFSGSIENNGGANQGDQIGRIFAHWVLVYFGQFFYYRSM
jgi:hypothetical protein